MLKLKHNSSEMTFMQVRGEQIWLELGWTERFQFCSKDHKYAEFGSSTERLFISQLSLNKCYQFGEPV